MCGLVGIISKKKTGFWQGDVKIFEQLLFIDQLRGVDGTGTFFNNKKNFIRVRKAPITASEYLQHPSWTKAKGQITQEATFVIGHNRFATKGGLVYKDTHPFQEGNITLVHNGTLFGHKELKDVAVDSHAICHSINDIGHIETLKKLEGAFALIWHDKSDNKLRFVRNTERPLHLVETQDYWIICSEKEMAQLVCKRNNITIKKDEYIPTEMLYEVDLNTMQMTKTSVSFKPKYSSYNMNDDDYVYYRNGYPKESYNAPKYNYKDIGEIVEFCPTEIKRLGHQLYLEGTMDFKDQKDIEVRFYSTNDKYLLYLQDFQYLVGNITQTTTLPGGHMYVVVRDVYEAFLARNGTIVTDKALESLNPKCDCCAETRDESKPYMLRYAKVWRSIDANDKFNYNYTCPDCVDLQEAIKMDTVDKELVESTAIIVPFC